MAEKTNGFFAEFRKFVLRGSVMDLAVGVIIGGAFKTIVDSLCNDILMPFIGIFVGRDTFSAIAFHIGGASIKFGNFIQSIVNFLIMALIIFCIVTSVNRLRSRFPQRKPEEETPPAPSGEEALLTEIRDLLKEQK